MSRRCKEELKESIIRVALELGSELGEEGLTMRAIASRLGVSATALYQHFESKASILQEIRMYGMDRLTDAISPAFELKRCQDVLMDIGRRYIDFAREHPWLYNVLMVHDQLEWATMSADEIGQSMRSFKATVQTIERGIEVGEVPRTVNPERASLQHWAALHGISSLILAGRFVENHPTIPMPNREEFVSSFIENLAYSTTLTCSPNAQS